MNPHHRSFPFFSVICRSITGEKTTPSNLFTLKYVERPSHRSGIEVFEPVTVQMKPTLDSSIDGQETKRPRLADSDMNMNNMNMSDGKPFPFFSLQKNPSTCFDRANLFQKPSPFGKPPKVQAPLPSNPYINNIFTGNSNSNSTTTSPRQLGNQNGYTSDTILDSDESSPLDYLSSRLDLIRAPSIVRNVAANSSEGYSDDADFVSRTSPPKRPPIARKRNHNLRMLTRKLDPADPRNAYTSNELPFRKNSIRNNKEENLVLPVLTKNNLIPLPVNMPPRDWTREFQEIFEKHPRLERGDRLHKLYREFVVAASNIGQTIIRERHLSNHMKTILPLNQKGICGGEKFLHNGIFFKYAIDSNNIFGGNDESAMKVAGHELKGLTALVSCGMLLGLNFGLMSLIDFRGFRLIATSKLPISQDTIVYGSCVGGNEVHADLPEMNEIMERCGRILNLKGHMAGIGRDKKFMYGPCDLEGHLGHDGKLYALDAARMLPPETPNRRLQGSFLYRLLRPEFVSRYHTALSSDAFTKFGEHLSEVHDREVLEANQCLLEKSVPDFARMIASLDFNSTAHDISWLLEELHRSGINIRHLGRIRSLLPQENKFLRQIVLDEIIARALVSRLRKVLRECRSPLDSDYNQRTADFLTRVFFSDNELWTDWIKTAIANKFEGALSDQESQPGHDLRCQVDMPALLRRLLKGVGVKLRSEKLEDYWMERAIKIGDVEGYYVCEKHFYPIPRIEADAAAELARTKLDRAEAQSLLRFAVERYSSVLELKPDDFIVLANLGNVLADLAKLKFEDEQENGQRNEEDTLPETEVVADASGRVTGGARGYFLKAYEKFSASSTLKPDESRTFAMWADALSSHLKSSVPSTFSKESAGNICPLPNLDMPSAAELFRAAEEKYREALRLKPNDPATLFNWANLLTTYSRILPISPSSNLAEDLLFRSAALYQLSLSFSSCSSSKHSPVDSLINWGCVYLRLAKLKKIPDEIHECLEEARNKFLAAEEKRDGSGSYNMACVSLLLGNFQDACSWLSKAFEVNQAPPLDVLLQDEDLEPLHAHISQMQNVTC
eukprot:TRINITY_DN14950_c0_g1_i1.p1 TRINITY_DN14950_c0_g1~~TRINITY_DN14950_c0_g1_i1.p1  ORF type:complete len:1069 (+),score=222.14 TRINITY_DN14950_c0_g1_i1:25-3231(+)